MALLRFAKRNRGESGPSPLCPPRSGEEVRSKSFNFSFARGEKEKATHEQRLPIFPFPLWGRASNANMTQKGRKCGW